MSNQVDLYNSTYGNFKEQVLAQVRQETYGGISVKTVGSRRMNMTHFIVG